jgi:NAD(P)-dependent dehydrogenase (short-subunit alcohol dehydrogenase family)
MRDLGKISHPSTSVLSRLFYSMWRQRSMSVVCPSEPRLDGRRALVTGGNAGIGLEISRGLVLRGAEVIMGARNEQSALHAIATFPSSAAKATFLSLNLADLESVRLAALELQRNLNGQQVDILIHNAGIWPQVYQQSAQGFEIAFATNVLGHYALTRTLFEQSVLSPTARVIVQTGDIYIMTSECTEDYRYKNALGGQAAYCRSKLGNLWYAHELQRRFPSFEVYVAHPGVVASGLVTVGGRIGAYVKRKILLNPTEGAQMCLLLATQSNLIRGAYYHNTLGRMILRPQDPAMNMEKAQALWTLLERLSTGSP